MLHLLRLLLLGRQRRLRIALLPLLILRLLSNALQLPPLLLTVLLLLLANILLLLLLAVRPWCAGRFVWQHAEAAQPGKLLSLLRHPASQRRRHGPPLPLRTGLRRVTVAEQTAGLDTQSERR